ncbi:CZB domain-containing protein [Celeribacter baekdonensis]|uniref:CZB domain-containing protein n=1 Tax=Celeribacter baekdonensis TaxID=875171 RepID=UPI003A92A902
MLKNEQDTQVRDAICAHAVWTRKLSECIDSGQLEKTSHDISCDDQCAFGKWLAGLSPATHDPAMKKFTTIKTMHTRFHAEAGKIAAHVENGDRAAARQGYEAPHFKRMTNSLIINLNDWREDFRRFT